MNQPNYHYSTILQTELSEAPQIENDLFEGKFIIIEYFMVQCLM